MDSFENALRVLLVALASGVYTNSFYLTHTRILHPFTTGFPRSFGLFSSHGLSRNKTLARKFLGTGLLFLFSTPCHFMFNRPPLTFFGSFSRLIFLPFELVVPTSIAFAKIAGVTSLIGIWSSVVWGLVMRSIYVHDICKYTCKCIVFNLDVLG